MFSQRTYGEYIRVEKNETLMNNFTIVYFFTNAFCVFWSSSLFFDYLDYVLFVRVLPEKLGKTQKFPLQLRKDFAFPSIYSIVFEVTRRWIPYHLLPSRKLHTKNTEKEFTEVAPVCLFNLLSAIFLVSISFKAFGSIASGNSSFLMSFFKVIVNLLIGDVIFFIGHYLMHHSFAFYSYAHALHHRSFSTSAVTAYYNHWLDYLLETTLPMAFPIIILKARGSTLSLLAFFGVFNAVAAHSGWDLPLFPDPHQHFMHHQKQYVNYGILVSDDLAKTADSSKAKSIEDFLHNLDKK